MVKYLDKESEREIIEAIRRAEAGTSGEIRVHVRRFCRGDALEEAKKIFRRLRMERTRERNAVLVFAALNSRRFAIIGDVGIHEKVGDLFWEKTRDKMRALFSEGRIKEGIVAGVLDAGERLKAHFPIRRDDTNELPDAVTKD